MGKGDQRTRRGKIWRGTHGKTHQAPKPQTTKPKPAAPPKESVKPPRPPAAGS